MRRIFAALLMTPVLLHAQLNKQAAGLKLEARTDAMRMAMPAVAGAASTNLAGTPMIRISTGVLAAKLIQRTEIMYSATELNATDNKIVVHLTVDEKGLPQDAKIVSSLNPALNERVLAAVRKYRFKPAFLDEQAVAEKMNLTFVFER